MISVEIQYHINLIILSRGLFRTQFLNQHFQNFNKHFQNFNKHFQNFNKHFQNIKIPKIHMILYSFL